MTCESDSRTSSDTSIPVFTLVFSDDPTNKNKFNVSVVLDRGSALHPNHNQARQDLEVYVGRLTQTVLSKAEIASLAVQAHLDECPTGWAEASTRVALQLLEDLAYRVNEDQVRTDLRNISFRGIYGSDSPSHDAHAIDSPASAKPIFNIRAFDSPSRLDSIDVDVTTITDEQDSHYEQEMEVEAARFTVQDALRNVIRRWEKPSIQHLARQWGETDTATLEYHMRQAASMTLREWPCYRRYAQSDIRADALDVTFPEDVGDEPSYHRLFPPH